MPSNSCSVLDECSGISSIFAVLKVTSASSTAAPAADAIATATNLLNFASRNTPDTLTVEWVT